MIKKILIVALVICSLLCFAGCSQKHISNNETGNNTNNEDAKEIKQDNDKNSDRESQIVVVPDRGFIAQVQDFYANFDDYKNKTIQIEGIYGTFDGQDPNKKMAMIYRRTPGCCGNDGVCGIVLNIPEGIEIPNNNSWIIVKGKLNMSKMGDGQNLTIDVKSLKTSSQSGVDFVTT